MALVLVLATLLAAVSAQGKNQFVENEENLRRALLSNYSTKVRPELKTYVYVSMLLSSLNHLDIARQSMSVNFLFMASWMDNRLRWNSSDYGGLDLLVTAPEDIWTPPLVIENSPHATSVTDYKGMFEARSGRDNVGVANVGVMGGKDRDGSPLRLNSAGEIMWTPPTEVTVSCEMMISQYPFDTQTCKVVVIGWTYPLSLMDLIIRPVDTSIYSENGEFDLMNTTTYTSYLGGPQESDTYIKVNFQFTFRRKWQFYGQNLLMPIMLNSILMNVAFLVPLESGEKTGYCLTVLLSYIVFLTWVTENLPPVSRDTSILQVYLAVVLCLGCLATILTTWILRLYHHPADKPVSTIYLALATRVLVPLRDRTCFRKRPGGRGNAFQNMTTRISPGDLASPRGVAGSQNTGRTPTDVGAVSFGDANSAPEKDAADILGQKGGSCKAWEVTRPAAAITWQELAALLDGFLFWVFAVSLVVVTTVIFSLLYVNY
ncbi:neuronal acetylcholine receptor subunit beta-3-like [Babylonia areolata]|uniref:neuronal acetylcholine receptor subunit beta-3-like n=1 Tax=Babylonia areolata TaxID=304850 RepID=UPI003FD623A8